MEDNSETTPGRLMEKYSPTTNGERRHARFDPTINLGHIISAGTALVSALVFAIGVYIVLNSRVLSLEEAKAFQASKDTTQATTQAARDAAQDMAVKDKFDDVKAAIQEVKSAVNELRRDVREKK